MTKEYGILKIDPFLRPFFSDIELRMNRYKEVRYMLVEDNNSLTSFANGHLYYGFHPTEDGWVYREWAPNAQEISLIGDFNDWNEESHKMKKLPNGNWELIVKGNLPHQSRVRLKLKANNTTYDRIPLYCKRIIQHPQSKNFDGVIWYPPEKFEWHDADIKPLTP